MGRVGPSHPPRRDLPRTLVRPLRRPASRLEGSPLGAAGRASSLHGPPPQADRPNGRPPDPASTLGQVRFGATHRRSRASSDASGGEAGRTGDGVRSLRRSPRCCAAGGPSIARPIGPELARRQGHDLKAERPARPSARPTSRGPRRAPTRRAAVCLKPPNGSCEGHRRRGHAGRSQMDRMARSQKVGTNHRDSRSLRRDVRRQV